ncbi:MAG: carotenoid biosynthesis protein [Bauldia sp.]|uniref:carotenoid biosynthesis protein n=1 Tax=Bauldia sp. TaxID=2575872 RepID=UPI001DFD60F7|nr:carotenoid biosynthesis protein [Bauldia sp.]MCB1496199.1 carotenoid biosynthesis protein [Bauldia sp.]
MQTKAVSRLLVTLGSIMLVAMAILAVALAFSEDKLLVFAATVLVTVFAFSHGVLRYGPGAMAFFVVIVLVIGWGYETVSILTGFPFGHYHYTDLLGPKVGLVPVIIMPSYFSVGYLAWTIASVLLGKRDDGVSGAELWLLPILSAFVMVMWDLGMDPLSATIAGEWIWEQGGPYFGIPLTNYAGWFLCVFTFYFAFALYLRARRGSAAVTVITTRAYWVLPILAYASITIEYWGNLLSGQRTVITDKAGHVWHTGDIYSSVVLISTFTMLFVALLGLMLVARTGPSETAG